MTVKDFISFAKPYATDLLLAHSGTSLYFYSELTQREVLTGDLTSNCLTNYGSGVGCVCAFTAIALCCDKIESEGEGSLIGKMIASIPMLGVLGWEVCTLGGSTGATGNPIVGDPIDMLCALGTGAAVMGLSYLTRKKDFEPSYSSLLRDASTDLKKTISSKFSPRKSPQCHYLEDKF